MSLTSAELKKRIGDILKDADLETTSAKKVRIQLEEDLDTDLTSRKEEIGKLIQEVMDENADDDEEENGDKEDEEEEPAEEEEEDEDEPEEESEEESSEEERFARQCCQHSVDQFISTH